MRFRARFKAKVGNDDDGWDTFDVWHRVVEAESISAAFELAEAKCREYERRHGANDTPEVKTRVSCELEYRIGPHM